MTTRATQANLEVLRQGGSATRATQANLEVLRQGGSATRATQVVLEVLRSTSIVATPGSRSTQQEFLVAGTSSAAAKSTQQELVVAGISLAGAKCTQQVFLVATRKGFKATFSTFREPTFHDWVANGNNVNYESYLKTWFIIPSNDTVDWSMTPYTYYFLKNGTVNDNSLKVQYFWDWSRVSL